MDMDTQAAKRADPDLGRGSCAAAFLPYRLNEFGRTSILRPRPLAPVHPMSQGEVEMKIAVHFLLAALLMLGAGRVMAQSADASKVPMGDDSSPIHREQKDSQRSDTKLAAIRSRTDLDSYLKEHPTSPFDAFSKRALERFVDSLTFNQLGLTGYRTAEMESDLTPQQAYAILTLFGVQNTISSLDFVHATDDDKKLLQHAEN